MCVKEYNYHNDFGYYKKLVVYPKKNGKYPVIIWNNGTGDNCGSGELTEEQLNEFLRHYKFISAD